MIDCANNSNPCGGGYISDVFEWAENENIESSDDYPFTGFSGDCWDQPQEG